MKFEIRDGLNKAMTYRLFHLVLVFLMGAATVAQANENDPTENTPDKKLNRAGLKVQWFSQAGIGVTGELIDWDYVIDENSATTFFKVEGGDVVKIFSEHDRAPNGEKYGVEDGLEYAAIEQEVMAAELKAKYNKEVEVKVSQYSVPKSVLYTLTSGALVRAIDAETGKTLWKTTVDNPTVQCYGVGASPKFVAVAAGQKVHCLDALTGKPLWSRECRSVISAPPAVRNDEVYVPLFNGRVEKFIQRTKGFNSTAFVSSGHVMTRPTVTGLTVGWGDSAGVFSVGSRWRTRATMGFQLRTERPVVAPPAVSNRTFFIGSQNGYLYSINELNGRVNWESSTGGPISQTPVVLGDFVYVINDRNQLHKFESIDGVVAKGWDKPRTNVKSFLGASETRMYFFDKFGLLEARDQDSGTITASANVGEVVKTLPHLKSDRMFLVDSEGTIRCVREIASKDPFFHNRESGKGSNEADQNDPFKLNEETDQETDGGKIREEDNPFGDG